MFILIIITWFGTVSKINERSTLIKQFWIFVLYRFFFFLEFPSSYSFLAKRGQREIKRDKHPKLKLFFYFKSYLYVIFHWNSWRKILECCNRFVVTYCFKDNRVLKGTNTPILNVYLKYDFDKVILLLISLIWNFLLCFSNIWSSFYGFRDKSGWKELILSRICMQIFHWIPWWSMPIDFA